MDHGCYASAKYGYLLLLGTEVITFLINIKTYSILFSALLLLPLLAPLKGIVFNNIKTYSWVNYIICFYAAGSVLAVLFSAKLLMFFYIFKSILGFFVFFRVCFLVKKHYRILKEVSYAAT